MASTGLIDGLMEALRCLPGVGPKTAQRMTYHLLERDRTGGARLAEGLQAALAGVGRCQKCRTLSENDLCPICANPARDGGQICIVESPADILALEQATVFKGRYFVLMGRLSPLDGIGPKELGLEQLAHRLAEEEISELIIATNPTVEGEATAHYLGQMARQFGITPTRIAHGVPLGGELEYIDSSTLAHAFAGRLDLDEN
jgi:recombination protein RecR